MDILAISGSLKAASTNSALLKAAEVNRALAALAGAVHSRAR